jgi:hypothetical protein
VKVIQLTADTTRQEHSRATPIDKAPVPPPGPNADVEAVTVASHRVDAGAVILVDVLDELPQPMDPRVNKANSRGARVFTRTAFAQGSPHQVRGDLVIAQPRAII